MKLLDKLKILNFYGSIDPIYRIYFHAFLGAIGFVIAISGALTGATITFIINAISFVLNMYLAKKQLKDLEINV